MQKIAEKFHFVRTAKKKKTKFRSTMLRAATRLAVAPLRGGAAARALASGSRSRRGVPQWTSPPPQHELWKPQPFLGAYYTLRPDDEAAMRNREKLKQKRESKRGRFIVDVLERTEREIIEAKDPWRNPALYRPGDIIQVEHCSSVGETADVVVGMMIGMHRRSLGTGFRLLCKVDETPVEYHFQLYSPLLLSMLVRQPSAWRDRKKKLFRLRDEVAKLKLPKPLRSVPAKSAS